MKTTKSEIIKKAAGLFVINGYLGTSMSNIGAAVGIKKAGLFFHFKNKEELYKAVLERYITSSPSPKHIFSQDMNLSLKEFIEAFSNKKADLINAMEEETDSKNVKFSQIMSFLLECSRLDPDCSKSIENFDKDMLEVWKVIVLKAQQCNEITDKLPAEQIATIIHMTYKGSLLSKSLCPKEPHKSKELLEKVCFAFKTPAAT